MFLDQVGIGPVVPGGAAPPDVGNVLKGAKEASASRFTWTDPPSVTSYRLYQGIDRDLTGLSYAGAATTGTTGVLDAASRVDPVHVYRVRGWVDCISEGP